jgi:hypothetical protein
MAAKVLRLNASFSDGSLVIAFSFPPSAQCYEKYLRVIEDFYENDFKPRHRLNAQREDQEVFMTLPPGVAIEYSASRSKDIILAFKDEEVATEWKDLMVIWE